MAGPNIQHYSEVPLYTLLYILQTTHANLEGLHVRHEGGTLHLGPESCGLLRGSQSRHHRLVLPHVVLCQWRVLLETTPTRHTHTHTHTHGEK